MQRLPGVDVRIVADRSQRANGGDRVIVVVILVIAAAGVALGILAGYWLPPHGRLVRRDSPRPVRRILLPFTGQAISRRSFEAAVRLATAENATVMPAVQSRRCR